MKLPQAKKKKETDIRKQKYLFYGQPGAGKSTQASQFPDAFFIATEPGLNHLECATYLNDDGSTKVMKTWDEFKDAVKTLLTSDHEYKTIVIDTVDNAFELCAQHIMKRLGIKHESDEDFGKAYQVIGREFKSVIDFLAASNVGLIFTSHEKIGQKEERGIKRMWIDNTLPTTCKKYINGLVDFIFYFYLDDDENRWVRTRSSLNIMAKDRTGQLPETIKLDLKTNNLVKTLTGVK